MFSKIINTSNEQTDHHSIGTNVSVTQLGLNPIFRTSNPFEWMVAIGIPNRTNFFEQRVSEYSKLGSKSTLEFDTTAEF